MMQVRCRYRVALAGIAMPLLAACSPVEDASAAAAMQAGVDAIRRYGCGTCHIIPGVDGADGTVGPSLAGIERQVYLAGRLPNTPDNMAQWIMSPQRFNPNTAMPDMQVTAVDARSIATFLRRSR